tara:strand:+ start:1832 stop:2299 length:468 start_codon:yes stop_codon:yes gene_type:complete
MAKCKYDEGSIFLVPLRTGGYARGVVSRCDGRGLVFGYFFGPRFNSLPDEADVVRINTKDAILIGQFGDIGLQKGEWPIISRITNWERKSWPMPLFTSSAEFDDYITVTEYDDDTLDTKSVTTRHRSEFDHVELLKDQVMGYGSVEKKLTILLEK